MHLNVLLDPQLNLPRLTQVLDEIGHLGRLDTVRGWSKATQAKIWEAAKGYRKLTLDHFVPPGVAANTSVSHVGKNTLPAFTDVDKRFIKPEGEGTELYGYNHILWMFFSGPGYFIARPGDEDGEVIIDYRRVPPGKAADWPDVVPNDEGFGRRIVYGDMVDVMRGVSNHVSIGRAMKGGKYMDAWFTIVRKDP